MDWNDISLRILSLTETETQVLNTLNTSKTVQDISKDSGISRTGVNHILKKLVYKKLVSFSVIGKRRVYIAISFEQLSEKLQHGLDKIKIADVNKKGARIVISKRDEFIIHVGTKEIIPAYNRIASENKDERIYAIQHHRSWNELIEKISPKQLVEFNEAIKRNHLIIDGILNKSAYEAYKKEIRDNPEKNEAVVKSLEGRMADYTYFSDEFFNYDAEIWIFKTTTLIINWHEGVAIEITNANMTGFIRDMFAFVKAGADKLDHNQAIRNLFLKK